MNPASLLIGVGVLMVVGLCGAVEKGQHKSFQVPTPDIRAVSDPAVIERGRYLVYGPAHCVYCHTPPTAATRVASGEELPLTGGHQWDLPPGTFYAPNLTPDVSTGIGALTDAEIARALRYGVGHDGRMLMPIMPFQGLSDEDLTAVVSFLRAQQPVAHKVPQSQWNNLGKVFCAFVLNPAGPTEAPPKAVKQGPTPEYGRYLATTVANCYGCHTNRDMRTGAAVGEPFAGGFEIPGDCPTSAGMLFVSPNLTPDADTGRISAWTEDAFIARFHEGPLIPGTVMPWAEYNRMTDDDLRALYRYLRQLKPVHNDTGPLVRQARG